MINHQAGQQIAQRYQILDQLGSGGSGFTYKAQDQQTGNLVALKALSLGQMETWKQMELFEREAKILQQLDHPAIPQYLDHFQEEIQGEYRFYIVQQLAPGQSLATLVEQGWQPQPQEVEGIAEQVLDVLVYLQALVPPVIHRDIKPQNLIYQSEGYSNSGEGNLFLVDFGAVQDVYHQTTVASTVVGTYGYMAPEQYRGQANLSTDLYGLATTLLFLLTGKSPSDLPERQLKIDFRQEVSISRDFANWLDQCLEPSLENRFPSAEAALEVWQGQRPLEAYSSQQLKQPTYSVVELQEKDGQLTVEIPPAIFRPRRDRRLVTVGIVWHLILLLPFVELASSIHPILAGLYGLAWVGSFSGWPFRKGSKFFLWGLLVFIFLTVIQIASFDVSIVKNWNFFNFTSTFLLGLLAIDIHFGDRVRRYWLSDLFKTRRVTLNPQDSSVQVEDKLFSWNTRSFNIKLLKFNRVHPITIDDPSTTTIVVGGLLTRAEKAWLTQQINNFLDRNSPA